LTLTLSTAFEAVRTETFDLVLMDLQMPGMDGIAATPAIRASGEPGWNVPIVAITASNSVEDVETCLAAGMQACLTKPYDCKQIEVLLEGLLPVSPVIDFVAERARLTGSGAAMSPPHGRPARQQQLSAS
jgi:CheY-like chemotaxis protein